MGFILTILAVSLAFWATPAAAGERLRHETSFRAEPKPVTSFTLAERNIELLAVTRRARADTARRRAHLDNCATMAKVMPGYPQPAFVSLDIRLNF
ncbi:hypothetical protein [Hyphococcus luteus]|uniref:UrcA family protein n=1 Tax=Hyphococcus luteus TaxID=2058213 RepID=A0A2S7K7V3_9PROT|nr:hypothetical protein [Marinicaulis flavus]PQA88573.1 hypothetical protein CW354_09835 [Marinicaulis flavus]